MHGSKHRQPHNALSFEDTENLVRFLFSYAEQNALLLPGRMSGYKKSDIQLLPSSKCNWGIWNVYCHTAGESEMHFAPYSTFCCGGVLGPSVLIMRPMSDLCCHPANAIGEYGMYTATLLVRVRCTLHHTLLSAVEEFWY